VIVGAVLLFTAAILQLVAALTHFEIIRMVFLLLPAMTCATTILKLAAITISLQILFGVPESALLFRVTEVLRLAAEVLPVVCIDTIFSFMLLVAERAPHGFKVKHVEVIISVHVLKHVY
jgi:hypothetical protein